MPPAHRRRPQSSRFAEVLMKKSKRKGKRRRRGRQREIMKGKGGPLLGREKDSRSCNLGESIWNAARIFFPISTHGKLLNIHTEQQKMPKTK